MKVWSSPSRLPPRDASWAQTRGTSSKQAPRRMTRHRFDVIHPNRDFRGRLSASGSGRGTGPHSSDDGSMGASPWAVADQAEQAIGLTLARGSVSSGADRLLDVQGRPEPPGELAGRALAPEV